jgi:hypothetical protein
MNYTAFTVHPFYADLFSNRFGMVLEVRKSGHGSPIVAKVKFPKGTKVTFRIVRERLEALGYKIDGEWKTLSHKRVAALLPA